MSAIKPVPGHATYILSGHLTTLSNDESCTAHAGLAHDLSQLLVHSRIASFLHCRGAYKGTSEQSIAVTGLDCSSLEATILELAAKYRQESVLRIVGSKATGELLFPAPNAYGYDLELIGQYQAIDSTNGIDAYTEVCATGETFTFV